MRRKEKQITTRQEIDDILHDCKVCHLAMAMDDVPYIVPLSFGYDGRHIYFHCATQGQKIEHLRRNPRVCFQMERNVRLITATTGPCHWTFSFESVVGHGTASEITDAGDKKYGLDRIVEHYKGDTDDYPDAAMSSLSVWRIAIESVSGKRSPKPES